MTKIKIKKYLLMVSILLLILCLTQVVYLLWFYTRNTEDYFTGYICSYTECNDGVMISIECDRSVEPGIKHLLVPNEDAIEDYRGKIVFENRLTEVYVVAYTEPYMVFEDKINDDYVYTLREMVVWPVEWDRIINEGIYVPPSNE